MKKNKLLMWLIAILIVVMPFSISAGGSDDDKTENTSKIYDVKCQYDLKKPTDESKLTTVYVYLNNSKLTEDNVLIKYVNKEKKEKVLRGMVTDFPNNNENFMLRTYAGDFGEYFIYHYKNQNKKCPNMYIYYEPGGYNSLWPVLNNSISSVYANIPATKKYTSSDGGKTWKDGENVTTDKVTTLKECDYNFSSLYGSKVNKDIDIFVTFKKLKNETTKKETYNLYFKGENYDISFNDVLGKDYRTVFSLGAKASGVGADVVVKISAETTKKILDGDKCLAKDKLYSYYDYTSGDDMSIIITHDKKEAEESGEDIYDGDSSDQHETGDGIPDPDVGNDLDQGTIQTGCEVIPEVVRKWINNILNFVRYVALALVIALGSLDFMKAAGSGEGDAMKKAGQSFMKRMIAVVILFLLPVIVDFILNMINIYGVDTNNIDCL